MSVLVDLVAPTLTFVRQLIKARNDWGHQLHDDRRGDVWIDTQGDDREVLQTVAREDVKNPQQRITLDKVLKTLSVDTGTGIAAKKRKMTSIPSVNRIFARRSGILKAVATAVSTD